MGLEIKDGFRKCVRCREFRIKISEHPKAEYCSLCLPIIKTDNLRNARLVRKDKLRVAQTKPTPTPQSTITLKAPDGSFVKLRDEEEKTFYEYRREQYTTNFEWNTSADASLLSRLLFLEILCNRQEEDLTSSNDDKKLEGMGRLTELIRKLQHDLGIDRLKRLAESERASAKSIIEDKLKRFKEYREKHKDRFCYKCKHCGKMNYLYREKDAPSP